MRFSKSVAFGIFLMAANVAMAQAPSYSKIGRAPTKEEIAAWDISVGPDGKGLPEGHGTSKEGAAIYAEKCAVCHGTEGDGKGDVVNELKLKLRDWRDPTALKDFTDGELFCTITKGKGAMPGEGDRAKPEQIWQMVIYLRSLAKSEPQGKPDAKLPA